MKTGFTNAAGFNIITSAERDGHRVIAVTMGHNTAKERDKKVASLMNKGLTKLALADNIETPSLYASKVETSSSAEETQTAEQTEENKWGVQVGAFSNYAKARNYALHIRQQINYAAARQAQIDIEPAQKGAAVVYRSKLVGMEKNEADNTCNRLKKSNKSCIVVAVTQNQQFAMADKK